MKAKNLSSLLMFVVFYSEAFCHDSKFERPDLKKYFDLYDATGTIYILDNRDLTENIIIYNSDRAKQRFSPASTFKVPHTLFALDSGIVNDEFQVFPWDGIERSYKPHNQDQTLRSAFRTSALWVFTIFAKEIGEQKANVYLNRINYGNMNSTSESGAYWVDGKLAISAEEQVVFLKKLYHNELPFELKHQLLLKDIMIVESGIDWVIRGKTGWEGRYGWWVGWVESPSGAVFFALNIDTPSRLEDLYKRKAITFDILKSIQALPPNKH